MRDSSPVARDSKCLVALIDPGSKQPVPRLSCVSRTVLGLGFVNNNRLGQVSSTHTHTFSLGLYR